LSVTLPVKEAIPWTVVGFSVNDGNTAPVPGVGVKVGVGVRVECV
jgi:hypothetical protein